MNEHSILDTIFVDCITDVPPAHDELHKKTTLHSAGHSPTANSTNPRQQRADRHTDKPSITQHSAKQHLNAQPPIARPAKPKQQAINNNTDELNINQRQSTNHTETPPGRTHTRSRSQEYVVHKIIRHVGRGKILEYIVQWYECGPTGDSVDHRTIYQVTSSPAIEGKLTKISKFNFGKLSYLFQEYYYNKQVNLIHDQADH